MPVWQKAMEAAVTIFELTADFPRVEDFALTSQLRRSSNSIPANIAEAFGRYHRANKLNFYYSARGSLCETLSHLHYASSVGYISAEQQVELSAKLDAVWIQMNQIIASLRRPTS